MLNLLLLFLIVVLLVLVIVMQATGWPAVRPNDADRLRRELLRELAGQRAESARGLHELKVELESLLRDGADEKAVLLLNRVEQAITLLHAIAAGARKRNLKQGTDEWRGEGSDPEEGGYGQTERVVAGRNPLLFQRQFALFSPDESSGIAACIPSADRSDAVEYLSVPAADFDPDLDPPYDPDVQAGSPSQRRP
ncbi:MAG: hypothetical protein K9G39_04080 [Chlorobium sp.]|uniref:hypothetical protein n=1 Tax=Chlorobium sp. TaxID=1095 RepID=UPI0025B90CAB|nr:hypothetical protein [Chlorobium sp.]MCF8382761.1 hypothetical protein [Chlorobium sp.]